LTCSLVYQTFLASFYLLLFPSWTETSLPVLRRRAQTVNVHLRPLLCGTSSLSFNLLGPSNKTPFLQPVTDFFTLSLGGGRVFGPLNFESSDCPSQRFFKGNSSESVFDWGSFFVFFFQSMANVPPPLFTRATFQSSLRALPFPYFFSL